MIFSIQDVFASEFQVKYFQHIDIYNFLENLSEWDSSHSLKSYKEYWKENKLSQNNDAFHLNNFKKIKLKYYYFPKESFFAVNDQNEDRIKNSFFNRKSYKQTYVALSEFLTNQELKEFNDCYNYFNARIIKIIGSKYSYEFILEKLNALNYNTSTIAYIKQTKAFYKTPTLNNKAAAVYLVWQPEQGGSIAYYINKNIILSLKDSDKLRDLGEKRFVELTTILLHEMMHYYSSIADKNSRLEFSSIINKSLNIQSINKIKLGLIIEEPLAVILGQQLFYKKYKKEYYNPYDNVYQDDWVKLMVLLVTPLVEHYIYYNYPMDQSFMSQYANLCHMALNAKNAL